MRRALEALGSGVLVYAVMAACSGEDGPGQRFVDEPDTGAPMAEAASGGATGTGGGRSEAGPESAPEDARGLVDRLTDPVPEAGAQEGGAPGPVVATEPCDVQVVHNNVAWAFAELQVPGRSAASLAGTLVLVPITTSASIDDAYEAVATVHVKDGAVAFMCGGTAPPYPSEVTFVVPPS